MKQAEFLHMPGPNLAFSVCGRLLRGGTFTFTPHTATCPKCLVLHAHGDSAGTPAAGDRKYREYLELQRIEVQS